MKREATDLSVKDMQKAIYMKQEKTKQAIYLIIDIMLNEIMKRGKSYRPV